MENLARILEEIESKRNDSISFKKKYKSRKIADLEKYYEGAEWAFTFALAKSLLPVVPKPSAGAFIITLLKA